MRLLRSNAFTFRDTRTNWPTALVAAVDDGADIDGPTLGVDHIGTDRKSNWSAIVYAARGDRTHFKLWIVYVNSEKMYAYRETFIAYI